MYYTYSLKIMQIEFIYLVPSQLFMFPLELFRKIANAFEKRPKFKTQKIIILQTVKKIYRFTCEIFVEFHTCSFSKVKVFVPLKKRMLVIIH